MKKVLFAIHSLGFGGAERSLVNLLNELPQDRYEVDLLLFRNREGFSSQLPSWVHVLETPHSLERLYAPMLSRGKYQLRKIVSTALSKFVSRKKKAQRAFRWRHAYRKVIQPIPGHYDVAVAYVGSEVMYFVHDCVSADKKLVWIHNDYRTAGYSRKDDAPYFAAMDAIVSVSDKCVAVLKEEFPEYQHKMYCVENITSSTVVRNMAEAFVPKEYSGCDCNLLSIGRLWPQKGFDMAIEAAAILKRNGLKFRWFVIGKGALEDKLRNQIEALSLQDDFILLGTRNNPYPYIKGCSVFVQPSRYEGKSVALDEAKIMCAPIVVTAYPTVGDQMSDRKEGLIVEMTPRGIAKGIMEMLENHTLRTNVTGYLSEHEYGNQVEVEKYMQLLDGREETEKPCAERFPSPSLVKTNDAKQPYFSIILPVFRVEKYLERCLQSILQQDFCDYEIILVDDGSPDRCPEICDDYAARYENIRVIHQQNGGLSSARNAGAKVACGKYIWWVDSDDWIELGALRTLYQAASETESDVVKFNYYRCTVERRLIQSIAVTGCVEGGEGRTALERQAFCAAGKYQLSAWSHLYRKEMLEQHGFMFVSERIVGSEDYLFNLEVLPHAKSIRVLPDALYSYDLRMESLTQRYREKLPLQYTELYHRLTEQYQHQGLYEKYKGLIQRFYVWHLIYGTCIPHEYSRISEAHTLADARKNVRAFLGQTDFQQALKHSDRSGLSRNKRVQLWAMKMKLEPLFYWLFVCKPQLKKKKLK